jgi:GTPase
VVAELRILALELWSGFIVVQVDTQPPTFVLFANRTDIPESYIRFLVNALREEFGFLGVPIRIHVRGPRKRV